MPNRSWTQLSAASSASPTPRTRGAIGTWRNTPTLQHSNTPTLQHSTTPTLHPSITPSLHHSITPSLHHSITPRGRIRGRGRRRGRERSASRGRASTITDEPELIPNDTRYLRRQFMRITFAGHV